MINTPLNACVSAAFGAGKVSFEGAGIETRARRSLNRQPGGKLPDSAARAARIPQDAYRPTFVRSLVMAPIGRPEPVAALGAYWADVHEHGEATIERVESLARLATIAI